MKEYCKTNPNCPFFVECDRLIETTTCEDIERGCRIYVRGHGDFCKWDNREKCEKMVIQDSGNRREFETGAVRDIAEDKGRCDLVPLDVVGVVFDDSILVDINEYVRSGNKMKLVDAIKMFAVDFYGDMYTAMMEVSRHYEAGAKKYAERNWEKGIPLHCYIDSGVRHYLKLKRGDKDEPHDRAFLWNLLGAIWTQDNKPELIDLPFAEK